MAVQRPTHPRKVQRATPPRFPLGNPPSVRLHGELVDAEGILARRRAFQRRLKLRWDIIWDMTLNLDIAEGHNWANHLDEALQGKRGDLQLARLARKIAKADGRKEAAVRKGLDRLRLKPHGDGGTYGRLLAQHFPSRRAEATGRYLGQYHGPVADLPASVRLRLIEAHDTSSFSRLPSAGWLHVARASIAVSGERWDEARQALDRVDDRAPVLLRLEVHSVRAFVFSRSDRPRAQGELNAMRALLDARGTREAAGDEDFACYEARWADQQAYERYKPIEGSPDLPGADQLYRALPEDGPPFVRLRRALGLSIIHLLGGDVESAEVQAAEAADLAGDLGLLRLRAQALRQLARCARARGDNDRMDALNRRAGSIARTLEDQNLAGRIRPDLR